MYKVGDHVLLKSFEESNSITCSTYLNPDMEEFFGSWFKIDEIRKVNRTGDEETEFRLDFLYEKDFNSRVSVWSFNEKWILFGTGDEVSLKPEKNEQYIKAKDAKLEVIGAVDSAQGVKCKIIEGKYTGETTIVYSPDLCGVQEEEEKKMENENSFVMHQQDLFDMPVEETDYLTKECIEKYDYCDIYDPKYDAVKDAVNVSTRNKAWLWKAFSQHPNYAGHGRIIFDADYERSVDKIKVDRFSNLFIELLKKNILEDANISVFSYEEAQRIVDSLNYKLDIMSRYDSVVINGKTKKEIEEDIARFAKIIRSYHDNTAIVNSRTVTIESQNTYKNIVRAINNNIFVDYNATITKEQAEELNNVNPDIRANGGQKKSRLVNKIAKLYGIDFDSAELRSMYAEFADAINPFVVKRHTVLSVNPADFLTMSWGTNWTSCHTIDKENVHGYEGHAASYRGCYSSGTHSYMLDGSSFIYYTVNGKKEVEDYGKELKESRQMFHIGEDKLIQGRLYPYDQTDCDYYAEPEEYTQIRVIVQRIISELFGIPNYWTNKKGTEACSTYSSQTGTHYYDITHYDNCNVSIIRGSENTKRIKIGHNPICPNCGREHDYEDWVLCGSCQNDGERECCECGSWYNIEDMMCIDGEWYCPDCYFYCEYHEEYETGDYIYVEDYGNVCEDAISNGDFYFCDSCNEYFYYGGDAIEINGKYYCCSGCAEDAGYNYVESEDGWYSSDETSYCSECDQYVLNENYNEELDMCNNCARTNEEEVAS